jgi:hypothetical protein
MILRSQLAKKANNPALAALWAKSARQLWSNGDPAIAELLRSL